MDEGEGDVDDALVVGCKTSVVAEPGEGSLDDQATRQQLPSGRLGTLDDLDAQARDCADV